MITKTNLLYLASFAGGALIGSAVTWRILKKKYEKWAQDEIDSVIETFEGIYNTDESGDEVREEDCAYDEEEPESENEYGYDGVETGEEPDNDIAKYNSLVGLYNGEEANILRQNAIKNQRPYSISYDEFGEKENEGYECVTLYYYADEILAYEDGNAIGNIDDVVGFDAIDELKSDEYGADTVFVRNDRLKADYEIIPSAQYYHDQEYGE